MKYSTLYQCLFYDSAFFTAECMQNFQRKTERVMAGMLHLLIGLSLQYDFQLVKVLL